MRKNVKKIQEKVGAWADKVPIPLYKNVTLLNVASFYKIALQRGNIGRRSASISFKFLIALFPLIIFLFSLIPFIPVKDLQQNLMTGIQNFFPDQIFHFFEPILANLILNKKTVLLSVGFVLTIYFASNAVSALIGGLNDSFHVKSSHRFLKQRLWSLALLFIFVFLFVLAFVIGSAGTWLIDYIFQNEKSGFNYWLLIVIKALLSVLTFLISISLLYNVANTDRIRWKFFNAGSIVSTLLIILLKESFGLYLTYFGKFDKIYGPLGSGLAFMLFIYYIFVLLILGFELNTSLEKAYLKKNYNFDHYSPEESTAHLKEEKQKKKK